MKKGYFFLALIIISLLTLDIFSQPQYYNYNTTGTNNAFPLNNNPATGKTIQALYLPGAFSNPTPAPSGNITKLYLQAATAGNATYTSLTIKMGLTTDVDLPTGAWYTGTMTTVYNQTNANLTSTAGAFFPIVLDVPFNYDPTKSLVVEISQCGFSGTGIGICYSVLVSGTKRSAGPLTALACPHVWGNQNNYTTNAGIDVAPPLTPNYAVTLPSPGVNTNYVSIPYQASMNGFPALTIEAWLKVGSTAGPNTVLNKGASGFDYQLGINAGGIPFFRAVGVIVTAVTSTITAGVWTHLAVSYNGAGVVTFYKNGVPEVINTSAPPGSSTGEMRIGRGNNDPGSGNIEEVRLWSVARTQGAIDSNKCKKYPSSFNNSTGLKALWHFDNNLVDSVSSYNGTVMGTITYDTVSFPIPGANCGLVGVQQIGNSIPQVYSLMQNYPNPFNPSTSITFTLPKEGFVELTVYDILGRRVGVLVQEPYLAGTYKVEFDAKSLASGVYFYTINVNDFSETKKMLLIK
jgi:hypothetical protein